MKHIDTAEVYDNLLNLIHTKCTNKIGEVVIMETGEKISYPEFFKGMGYQDDESVYVRTYYDDKADKKKYAEEFKKKNGRNPKQNESYNPLKIRLNSSIKTADFDKLCRDKLYFVNSNGYGVWFVVNGCGQNDNSVLESGKYKSIYIEWDDISFREMFERLKKFPLIPSTLIITKKSLHVYWFSKDGDSKAFRTIQKRMIAYFGSDKTIHNESRVMRIPGFFHNKDKKNPVMVRLLRFCPELRYTQDQIISALDEVAPELETPSYKGINDNISEEVIKTDDSFNSASAEKSIQWLEKWLGKFNIETEQDYYTIKPNGKNPERPVKRYSLQNENDVPWKDDYTTTWCAGDTILTVDLNGDYAGQIGVTGRHNNDKMHTFKEFRIFHEPGAYDHKNDLLSTDDLARFHRWSKEDKNGNKTAIDIMDVLICQDICEKNNIIVVEGQPYLYRDGCFKIDQDGLRIKLMIQKHIYQHLIKNTRIEQCFKLLISDPSLHHDLSELNKHPKEWINCLNGMLDAKNMKLYPHSPDYMSINQIPLEYIPEEINTEGISYQFVESLIPDKDDREMFLQFCGLCLTKDTSPQKELYMIGGGGTGKSTTINMVCNVIGSDNISGLSLQDINKRFYPTCLVGKLMNACADIPSMKMDTVDIIKKIIGEDVIMGEYKGGKTFFFRSYAKLMFSANKIPKVYDDKTDAYYRRLLILEIRKKAKHFDDLEARLFEDRQNFFRMILEALNRMYSTGFLFESDNSKRLVHDLYVDSDTVFAFLEDKTRKAETSASVSRKRVYEAYTDYCSYEGRTSLTAHKFREELENRGYIFCKVNGYDYIKGLELV